MLAEDRSCDMRDITFEGISAGGLPSHTLEYFKSRILHLGEYFVLKRPSERTLYASLHYRDGPDWAILIIGENCRYINSNYNIVDGRKVIESIDPDCGPLISVGQKIFAGKYEGEVMRIVQTQDNQLAFTLVMRDKGNGTFTKATR